MTNIGKYKKMEFIGAYMLTATVGDRSKTTKS